jgi:hypothetical protein
VLSAGKEAKKKQEERKSYEMLMTRVKLGKVDQEEIPSDEVKPLYKVAVNAMNVRFLDRILSKKCKKCNSIKPPHSHHCSTCKRCIARMDHHCPWVNNCVGFYNQKFFILFLVYVFLGSGHALYIIAKNSIWCFDKNCAIFQTIGSVVLSKSFP